MGIEVVGVIDGDTVHGSSVLKDDGTGVVTMGPGVLTMGSGVLAMGSGVLEMGSGVLAVGSRVVATGEEVLPMGAAVDSIGAWVRGIDAVVGLEVTVNVVEVMGLGFVTVGRKAGLEGVFETGDTVP